MLPLIYSAEEVPVGEYTLPLSKAEVVVPGECVLSITSMPAS